VKAKRPLSQAGDYAARDGNCDCEGIYERAAELRDAIKLLKTPKACLVRRNVHDLKQ